MVWLSIDWNLPFIIISPNKIIAVLPEYPPQNYPITGGNLYNLILYGNNGDDIYDTTGILFYPAPQILTVSPTFGFPGDTVRITASNLTSLITVNLEGYQVPIVKIDTPNKLTVVIPDIYSQNGTYALSVINGGGGAGYFENFNYYPGPVIDSVSRFEFFPGDTIFIYGKNFVGVNDVIIGSVGASIFDVISSTKIRAVFNGYGTTMYDYLSVFSNNSLSHAKYYSLYYNSSPSIDSVSNRTIFPGDTVFIYGKNFNNVDLVRIDGLNASSFDVISSNLIKASFSGYGNTLSGYLELNFYINGYFSQAYYSGLITYFPKPSIDSVSNVMGFPGDTISIFGENFFDITQVKIGNEPCEGYYLQWYGENVNFTVKNKKELKIVLPSGLYNGNYWIKVTNSSGYGSICNFYYYPEPTITSVNPAQVFPGDTLFITGNNFIGVSSLAFGPNIVEEYYVISPNRIKAVIGNIGTEYRNGFQVYTNDNKSVASTEEVIYYPSPIIDSIHPGVGYPGDTIIISGQNFIGVSQISLTHPYYNNYSNGNFSSFMVLNSTKIKAILPSGFISGNNPIKVTTGGGSALSENFNFFPAPSVDSIFPAVFFPGDTVYIRGRDFVNISNVVFGNDYYASSFEVIGSTMIIAIVGSYGRSFSGNINIVYNSNLDILYTDKSFLYHPPPVLDSLSKYSGFTGDTVRIYGKNFIGINYLGFRDQYYYYNSIISYSVISANEISIILPSAYSGIKNIFISTQGGNTSYYGFDFYPIPVIDSFSPRTVFPGDTVDIWGKNFIGVSKIAFGPNDESNFETISPQHIRVVAGNYGYHFTQGLYVYSNFNRSYGYLDGLNYYPQPILYSASTLSGSFGIIDTLKGKNFKGVLDVRFGTKSAAYFEVINDSLIIARVGTGASGLIEVVTYSGIASIYGFNYEYSSPSITRIEPSVACSPGVEIKLRGNHFAGTTSVMVGGYSVNFTLQSDTLITFYTGSNTNSGKPELTNPAGKLQSDSVFIMSRQQSSLTVLPSPFQICESLPRKVYTNLPDFYSYYCSNGQSGKNIQISSPGNYSLTAIDPYGCIQTTNFSVTNLADCAGYLEIETDSIVNYFDTLDVKIRIRNGKEIFSAFAYLNFNTNHLRLVSSKTGDFLGNNLITQPPVISTGRVDFGMSKVSSEPGSNGDGIVYEFKFVLLDELKTSIYFSAANPNYYLTQLSLSNILVYNKSGNLLNSFVNNSMKEANVACRYYVPVWPGDLNTDGRVNVADILPIGYFYGSAGPKRPDGNLIWRAQPAILWGTNKENKTSAAYKTFADGNGDGLISLADQTAIGFNLGSANSGSNTRQVSQQTQTNRLSQHPELKIACSDSVIKKSSLPLSQTINIHLGNSLVPANNIYGLAFDIFFDTPYVSASNIVFDYFGTIFGTEGVHYTKIEDRSSVSTGRISVGLTRINGVSINSSGGLVLKLQLGIPATAPVGTLRVNVNPIQCNDQLGNLIILSGIGDSLIISSVESCENNFWNGTFSNFWHDPQNWSCGTVPGPSTIVYIDAGKERYPIIVGEAYCKKIINNTQASLTISDSGKLNILGN